jgi:hypothetical protein
MIEGSTREKVQNYKQRTWSQTATFPFALPLSHDEGMEEHQLLE